MLSRQIHEHIKNKRGSLSSKRLTLLKIGTSALGDNGKEVVYIETFVILYLEDRSLRPLASRNRYQFTSMFHGRILPYKYNSTEVLLKSRFTPGCIDYGRLSRQNICNPTKLFQGQCILMYLTPSGRPCIREWMPPSFCCLGIPQR